jgi:hypothetical protein
MLLQVRLLAALVLAVAALFAGSRAEAQATVDLQLVLAVDTSGSVSNERFILQQQGYVAAFRSPRLLAAILSGSTRSVAVTMTQWTGPAQHLQVVPWTLIKDEASMLGFAEAIDRTARQLFGGGTSVSGAIDHAMVLLSDSAFVGSRRVIDVSGDGANNRGRPSGEARDDAVREGVVINGLPILALEPYLDDYYRNHVIGGAGSFVIVTKSYEDFAEAVLMKLIIEISSDGTAGQAFDIASAEP